MPLDLLIIRLLITLHSVGATVRWRERAYHLAGQQLRQYVAEVPLLHVSAGLQPVGSAHCAAPQATPVMDRNLQENARERGEDRNQPGPATEPADTPSPPTVPCGPS